MKKYTYEYDSFGDYLKKLENSGYDDYEKKMGTRDFCDSLNFNEAINKHEKGREIKESLTELISVSDHCLNEYEAFSTSKGVVGSFVDVGSFLSNDPEHFWDFKIQESSGKTIEVNLNLSCPASVNKLDINKGALNLLKAINSLEVIGYSVKVNSVVHTNNGEKTKEVIFKIKTKDYGEVLNPNTFFSLISVDFLRVFYLTFTNSLFKEADNDYKYTGGRPIYDENLIEIIELKKLNTQEIIDLIIKKNN